MGWWPKHPKKTIAAQSQEQAAQAGFMVSCWRARGRADAGLCTYVVCVHPLSFPKRGSMGEGNYSTVTAVVKGEPGNFLFSKVYN